MDSKGANTEANEVTNKETRKNSFQLVFEQQVFSQQAESNQHSGSSSPSSPSEPEASTYRVKTTGVHHLAPSTSRPAPPPPPPLLRRPDSSSPRFPSYITIGEVPDNESLSDKKSASKKRTVAGRKTPPANKQSGGAASKQRRKKGTPKKIAVNPQSDADSTSSFVH